MRQIIGAFGSLLILIFHMFICITLTVAAGEAEAAKSYKAAVIAQIENSDFNPDVIAGCISQAAEAGYVLTVNSCTYDEEMRVNTAEVILEYKYELPLFNMQQTKETRGFAR
jgi:DNA-binding LacI/PurR family transcriptional regulator